MAKLIESVWRRRGTRAHWFPSCPRATRRGGGGAGFPPPPPRGGGGGGGGGGGARAPERAATSIGRRPHGWRDSGAADRIGSALTSSAICSGLARPHSFGSAGAQREGSRNHRPHG